MDWLFLETNGFDEKIAIEFAMQLKKVNDEDCVKEVKGLNISLNVDVLRIITIISEGKKWDQEDSELPTIDKHTFFKLYKTIVPTTTSP